MVKSKIIGLKNINYPAGRIDTFEIAETNGTFEQLVSTLVKLGFCEESIWAEIDGALEHREFLFLYLNKTIKLHLLPAPHGKSFIVRIDSSFSREKIINAFESFFEFP